MISIIIPVINQIGLTEQLLCGIYNNISLLKEIFLIDNGSKDNYTDLIKKFNNPNITYIRNKNNIGVNPSWNLGISLSTGKYISILNNDIIINKSFFSKISDTFENNSNIGIVVPNTVSTKYIESDNNSPEIRKISKREGWAFTIRKEITDKIPPIPKELNKCFGDDYLFYWTWKLGYKIVKIMNNQIFHYGSMTQIHEVKKKHLPNKEDERIYWNKIKEDIDKTTLQYILI